MNNELLSVIIPVYNEEKYLKEAIDSVIAQIYQNLEIILVDDGSTDSSPTICDYYATVDKRIKVIHQNNCGMIAARYAGIKAATGKYAIFLDGDDFIAPQMYMELMNIVEKYNVDMVGCGAIRYRAEDDFVKDICYDFPEGLYEKKEIVHQIYSKMLWDEKTGVWAIDPSLCMKIIKREILLSQYERIYNYSFSYGEDSAIIYPAILGMEKIYLSHECYYYHRKRDVITVAPYLLSENFLEQLLVLYKYLYKRFSEVQTENNLIMQLDMFYMKSVNYLNRRYPQMKKNGPYKRYLFPFDKVNKGSRIVLYGAGTIGKQYWEQIGKIKFFEDVLWVDKNPEKSNDSHVTGVENIDINLYDYIVIAIKSREVCKLLFDGFVNKGWKTDQLIIPDFEVLEL